MGHFGWYIFVIDYILTKYILTEDILSGYITF